MNDIALQSKEKTAQLLWTVFILMFFVIQAIIWTFAISITSRDSSHAVVAGYDEQALSWDEVKQERAASKALGWTTEIKVDPTGDIRGNRVITIVVTDRKNRPVENATVQLDAYHRGRAAEVQCVEFNEVGQGVYSSEIQIRQSGAWVFDGTVSVENRRLLIQQTIQLNANKGQ